MYNWLVENLLCIHVGVKKLQSCWRITKPIYIIYEGIKEKYDLITLEMELGKDKV